MLKDMLTCLSQSKLADGRIFELRLVLLLLTIWLMLSAAYSSVIASSLNWRHATFLKQSAGNSLTIIPIGIIVAPMPRQIKF